MKREEEMAVRLYRAGSLLPTLHNTAATEQWTDLLLVPGLGAGAGAGAGLGNRGPFSHCWLLAHSSPWLSSILAGSPDPRPVLLLDGVGGEDVAALLNLLWTGRVAVRLAGLTRLVDLAAMLGISGVTIVTRKESVNDNTERDDKNILDEQSVEDVNNSDLYETLEQDDFNFDRRKKEYFEEEPLDLKFENNAEMNDSEHKRLSMGKKVGRPKRRRDTNISTLICSECGHHLKSKDSLAAHMKNKHGPVTKYYCDQCDYSAMSKFQLETHQNSKHENKFLYCENCHYKTASKYALRKHIEVQHNGVSFPCEVCGHQSKSKCALKTHQQMKHEGVFYSCKYVNCDYKSKQKSRLQIHVDIVHEGLQRYVCTHCGHQASCGSALKAHIESKHEGITFECDLCKLKFRQKYYLKVHQKKVHEKLIENHPCGLCDQFFKSARGLKHHVDDIHLGITHNCDDCGRVFKRRDKLLAHMKSTHAP